MTQQQFMRIMLSPFPRALASTLIGCSLFMTGVAWAKSASEVFETAAGSIVVVKAEDSKGKSVAFGSGVVIAPGVVATNCHVIEKAVRYAVKHGASQFTARLKHADWERDVCSLTAQGLNAPASILGGTKQLKVGQRVYAIGAPSGLELTLSEGILSSLRDMHGGRYLQISAPISQGSSGGGLFDDEGRLIGLPTFYLSEGQQLNFAVPVEWIEALPQRADQAQIRGKGVGQWLAKAIDLETKNDWQGMLKHSLAWSKKQPRHIVAWLSLGVAYSETGQPAKAIKAYQQALRINPEDANIWNNLGFSYGRSGQTEKQIEAYKQALRINPEDASTWYNLGVIYSDKGQTVKEIEAYKQALRINPEDASTWYNIGVTYSKSGQPAKAIEAYQQALRINPEVVEVWFNLGVTYAISGQRDQLTVVYQRLKQLDAKLADSFFEKIILH